MNRRKFVSMLAALPVVGAFFGAAIAKDKPVGPPPPVTAQDILRRRDEARRFFADWGHRRLMPNLPCGGKRMVVRKDLPPVGWRKLNAGIPDPDTFHHPLCVQVDIPREDLDRLRVQLAGATDEQINDALTRYVGGLS